MARYKEGRSLRGCHQNFKVSRTEAEFKEFKSGLKSAKTRFKLSAGLNLETFDTNLSGTNHI